MYESLAAIGTREPVYGDGLVISRFFTRQGVHPFDEMVWDIRDARITNEKGEAVFEQKGVEVPASWSQSATNIVVSKYFRGKVGESERESSVKQLMTRVANTIAKWGRCDGYFQTKEDADVYEHELLYILTNQMAAFNSPVWFNVGVNSYPQCSACFINAVQDDMRSILNLCVTEGMLFKGGSGAGVNLSILRSKQEYLRGSNGRASGPVSFMRGFDAFAGVIKSGGKTRRAAKMVILNIDHPDIEDFITAKAIEEKKAWALMDAGYDGSIDGNAYSSVFFQNANHSVRVTDEFMRAVEDDREWVTHEVVGGKESLRYRAKDLMKKMCDAAWQCGDPGIQYDTTINTWHTCKGTDRIHASNPCSEYMFLNDTACNLASLNLMKLRKEVNGRMEFDVKAFEHVSRIIITAMEIIVGNSSYPTPAIERNSHDYRSLGIGYANLGALLMSHGYAYDSQEGRNLAAAITALLSGYCYHQSTKIAEKRGAFAGYKKNRDSFLQVMRMHRDEACHLQEKGIDPALLKESCLIWNKVVEDGEVHGSRNAQISVLAPTGTIAFLMDCDTTGVEPDIALVKYKWLVGGGMMKIVNRCVKEALQRLGYTEEQQRDITTYIDTNDTIEGAPHLKEEHLSVFDCAFKPVNGKRTIHYMGHLRMMAAVQPFISGAISKTVNLPHDSTPEDIGKVYMEGWKMGIKAIAVYRDGSKRQQALTTTKEKDSKKVNEDRQKEEGIREAEKTTASVISVVPKVTPSIVDKPRRRRLPDERRSITHKFSVGSHEGYINVGLYDDGTPGEIFITMSKQGSVIRGLMDCFATSVSIGLQYGVPLEVLVNKFVHMRFEPSGYTNNPQIRIAKSIIDYLFRWLAMKFLPRDVQMTVGVHVTEDPTDSNIMAEPVNKPQVVTVAVEESPEAQSTLFAQSEKTTTGLTSTFDNQSDAPACMTCGSIMVRNGSCYKCLNCGATSGCS
ncbi:TPA: vitamin B12-dependent ribonucleotide reductase [Candidatus Uhrbacteria bacterium]|nr:vitamin B12-dependent ribonucleotide reductase [Candidatus Uhrbacteria bacterium]HCB19435.1 vitamin B12-dependent ribonucleotide reductase [Candidatus Uhrbacteria bacterium]